MISVFIIVVKVFLEYILGSLILGFIMVSAQYKPLKSVERFYMIDLIGTWGVYPWFHEDGEDLIHPLDLYRFKERFLYSGGKVFFCKDIAEGYIVLKYKGELFRLSLTYIRE